MSDSSIEPTRISVKEWNLFTLYLEQLMRTSSDVIKVPITNEWEVCRMKQFGRVAVAYKNKKGRTIQLTGWFAPEYAAYLELESLKS